MCNNLPRHAIYTQKLKFSPPVDPAKSHLGKSNFLYFWGNTGNLRKNRWGTDLQPHTACGYACNCIHLHFVLLLTQFHSLLPPLPFFVHFITFLYKMIKIRKVVECVRACMEYVCEVGACLKSTQYTLTHTPV